MSDNKNQNQKKTVEETFFGDALEKAVVRAAPVGTVPPTPQPKVCNAKSDNE